MKKNKLLFAKLLLCAGAVAFLRWHNHKTNKNLKNNDSLLDLTKNIISKATPPVAPAPGMPGSSGTLPALPKNPNFKKLLPNNPNNPYSRVENSDDYDPFMDPDFNADMLAQWLANVFAGGGAGMANTAIPLDEEENPFDFAGQDVEYTDIFGEAYTPPQDGPWEPDQIFVVTIVAPGGVLLRKEYDHESWGMLNELAKAEEKCLEQVIWELISDPDSRLD